MLSKIQTSDDVKVGLVEYLTEFIGDAPISVYVIHGRDGDMLVDTGFSTTFRHIQKWISRKRFNITDIYLTHAHPDHDWNAASVDLMNSSYNKILKIAPEYLACGHGVPFLFSEKSADK